MCTVGTNSIDACTGSGLLYHKVSVAVKQRLLQYTMSFPYQLPVTCADVQTCTTVCKTRQKLQQ